MKTLFAYGLLFTFYFLLACTNIPGTPGHISEHTSKFDNTRQLDMEPAWCDGTFKLSLFKTSTMPDSFLILTVVVKDIYSFDPGHSLQVRIGQRFYQFEGLDEYTDHKYEEGSPQFALPPTAWSLMRYAISMKFLEEMITAEEVWIKISLDKDYMEGKFSTNGPVDARPAFRNFYEKIQGW